MQCGGLFEYSGSGYVWPPRLVVESQSCPLRCRVCRFLIIQTFVTKGFQNWKPVAVFSPQTLLNVTPFGRLSMHPVSGNGIPDITPSSYSTPVPFSGAWPKRNPGILPYLIPKICFRFNIQDPGFRTLRLDRPRILASGSSNRRAGGKQHPPSRISAE